MLTGQLVDQSDVCECATHHNFIVTSSRPLSVLVFRFDALRFQKFTCRGSYSNIARRTYMISSNTVSYVEQTISVFDFLDVIHAFFHGLEERRVVDV